MITVALVSAAVLALLFFVLVFVVRGYPRALARTSQLQAGLLRVDLAAFRNLMDPEEETYLRVNLPAKEFRRIQRERLRAALDYLGVVAQNAVILINLAEAASRSDDVLVSQAGQALLDNALHLRVATLLVRAKIVVGIMLPAVHVSSSGLSDSYESLTSMASRLTRLQNGSRVASPL
jgi:hypothetical protein